MTKVYFLEIFDKDGNLKRIDFFNQDNHDFEFQAMWDEREAQTQENREAFRKWAFNMAKNMGYEVIL
jgi:hypothetical protein